MSRGPIPDKPSGRPTVDEVVPLCVEYYRDGNFCGGNLHIVLDDTNLADHHIEWCLKQAAEEGDTAGVRIAKLMLQMTRTQRQVHDRTHDELRRRGDD